MKRWNDIRDKHVSAAGGAEAVRADKDRLLTQFVPTGPRRSVSGKD
jgi:hypothetical protein